MTMTPEQIQDFRTDLGDDGSVFTEAEIQRFYERANGSYERALILGLDVLIADAAKFNNYTQNQSSESKSQIFDHLLKLREVWLQTRVNAGNQVRIVGMKSQPQHNPWRRKRTPTRW